MNFLQKALVVVAGFSAAAQDHSIHTLRRLQLSDQFWCEGANFADFNRDGVNDIVSGPWWYEGPGFTNRHELYAPKTTFKLQLGPMTTVDVPGFEGALGTKNTYSDNFFAFPRDFNQDGWPDVLIIGFPGQQTVWFETPSRPTNTGNVTSSSRRPTTSRRPSPTSPATGIPNSSASPRAPTATRHRTGATQQSRGPGIRSRRTRTTATSPTAWASAT